MTLSIDQFKQQYGIPFNTPDEEVIAYAQNNGIIIDFSSNQSNTQEMSRLNEQNLPQALSGKPNENDANMGLCIEKSCKQPVEAKLDDKPAETQVDDASANKSKVSEFRDFVRSFRQKSREKTEPDSIEDRRRIAKEMHGKARDALDEMLGFNQKSDVQTKDTGKKASDKTAAKSEQKEVIKEIKDEKEFLDNYRDKFAKKSIVGEKRKEMHEDVKKIFKPLHDKKLSPEEQAKIANDCFVEFVDKYGLDTDTAKDMIAGMMTFKGMSTHHRAAFLRDYANRGKDVHGLMPRVSKNLTLKGNHKLLAEISIQDKKSNNFKMSNIIMQEIHQMENLDKNSRRKFIDDNFDNADESTQRILAQHLNNFDSDEREHLIELLENSEYESVQDALEESIEAYEASLDEYADDEVMDEEEYLDENAYVQQNETTQTQTNTVQDKPVTTYNTNNTSKSTSSSSSPKGAQSVSQIVSSPEFQSSSITNKVKIINSFSQREKKEAINILCETSDFSELQTYANNGFKQEIIRYLALHKSAGNAEKLAQLKNDLSASEKMQLNEFEKSLKQDNVILKSNNMFY
ncbi:hypothetical protein IJG72_00485 [bacterium]|nr:hypothetical protein [bacterium]